MTEQIHAVILFSGGLDSTVLLTLAVQRWGRAHVLPVNVSYGSRHNVAERKAAAFIAGRLGVAIPYTINLPPDIYRGSGSGSALMVASAATPPEKAYDDGPQATVVPFRNGAMISVATALALTVDATTVGIAVHANDHSHWAYPDCSPEFMGAMSAAVFVGTYEAVRLWTPFIWMMKYELVSLAREIGAPINQSYSCYRGGALHCGRCATCIERNAAFETAGYQDPTEYDENNLRPNPSLPQARWEG